MTDRIGAFYVETDTQLSWLIRLGANCDENQIEQYVTNCRDVVYAKNKA